VENCIELKWKLVEGKSALGKCGNMVSLEKNIVAIALPLALKDTP